MAAVVTAVWELWAAIATITLGIAGYVYGVRWLWLRFGALVYLPFLDLLDRMADLDDRLNAEIDALAARKGGHSHGNGSAAGG